MRTLRTLILTILLLSLLSACTANPAASHPVSVRETKTIIPTYAAGDPEPNPMFYFGKQSQGAQGRVYPYPLYDNLTNTKIDKTYNMVTLENEYLRIAILPEIGGRLFEALDKSNNYDFIYRQHVIKPALIGLIGAWMSGGIEWNIPHHHRASTFLPVQYSIETDPDGSATIWVGELEVRQRMRWAVGYTLHPGKSYLEAKVRILNRTPVVNTMLCFANVAIHANDDYQVLFPPSTQYVTYHSKNQFATWPIATGRYSGADFGQGTDVSWYKNHIQANSMFAWNYQDDFFGGYDHGKEAGIISVADHNIIPGKKFWTWGNGPRGRMWDHILTDNDGPYEELMVGAYSDNQPDYSWLQPFEAKSFSMYWYPFRDIGGLKNANLDAAVNLEVANNTATLGFCSTCNHPKATARLTLGDKVLLEETTAIAPGKPFTKKISLPAGTDIHALKAALLVNGQELVAYTPIVKPNIPMPDPISNPGDPAQIKTVEELYLTGLRAEQFNAPRTDPEPYWLEALRRDPGDIRTNTALGIRRFKAARFTEAEALFRKALERATANYTTPKDAEATYYLGLTLQAQGKDAEAYATLYRATWNNAQRDSAYFTLAELATKRGDFPQALDFANRSLDANAQNTRAAFLKSALRRHMNIYGLSSDADPLDPGILAERWLLSPNSATGKTLADTLNTFPQNAQEVAVQYLRAGLYQDGLTVLDYTIKNAPDPHKVNPIIYYDLAHFARQLKKPEDAQRYANLAASANYDYVFPFQYEQIAILQEAMDANPKDARALYYLGNLLFDWQPELATLLWEKSIALDPNFAITQRNVALSYNHQRTPGSATRAIAALEKAVSQDRRYALHFTELDELYIATGAPAEKRLSLMEKNHAIITQRDDALSHEVGLKLLAGKYDDAITLLTGRTYSAWEGTSLPVADYWTLAHLLRGRQNLIERQPEKALADFKAAAEVPDNLPSEGGRGGGGGGREIQIAFMTGQAYEALGNTTEAQTNYAHAANAGTGGGGGRGGRGGGAGAGTAGNEELRYFQALAFEKLNQPDRATTLYQSLANTPTTDPNTIDKSAPAPDQLTQRTRIANAHLAAALGNLGLKQSDQARSHLTAALTANPDNLPAQILQKTLTTPNP